MSFARCAALRPGDPVSVVAPSGPFDAESFAAGIALLGARYELRLREDIGARERYLAGSDERRLQELVDALREPTTKAVFCARGGYGAMRLLPELALAADLRSSAKALIGCSDITALHAWRQQSARVSIHGPVITQLPRLAAGAAERLYALLESRAPPATLGGTECYVGGVAEGPLVGGNLSVLTRLLGTPYSPPLQGAVLLLEDVGERPYRLDRMWTHLRLAGVFEVVRGIVLGSFTACEEKDGSVGSREVLISLARQAGLPCAAGFPIGHGSDNEAVALGTRVRLDAETCRLSFLEAAVQ